MSGLITKDAWEDAYEQLKSVKPNIIAKYQEFILEEGTSKRKKKVLSPHDVTSASGILRVEQLMEVIEEQQKQYEDEAWEITVRGKEVKVRDCINSIAKDVVAGKDFIATAASNEPHAALAWAGVSILLPLLLNAHTQEIDALTGLREITDTILEFNVLQRDYLDALDLIEPIDNDTQKLLDHIRGNTVALYRLILEYQFTLAYRRSGLSFTNWARDLIKRDDWKGLTDDPKALKAMIKSSVLVINQKTSAAFMVKSTALTKQHFSKAQETLELIQRHNQLRDRRRFEKETASAFVDDVKAWLDDGTKMIFWVQGIPGVGKSMAMWADFWDSGWSHQNYAFGGLHEGSCTGFKAQIRSLDPSSGD